MKYHVLLVTVLVALSSCDIGGAEADAWGLERCVSPGEASMLIMSNEHIGCVRGGELMQDSLDGIGFYVSSTDTHFDGAKLFAVLQDGGLRSDVYGIEMSSGVVDRVMPEASTQAKIVSDTEATWHSVHLYEGGASPDSSTLSVYRHENGESAETASHRILTGGQGFDFIDADVTEGGCVLLLAAYQYFGTYAVVTGCEGEVRIDPIYTDKTLLSLEHSESAGAVVTELFSGDIYRVDGTSLVPIADVGGSRDDTRFPSISRGPMARFYVPGPESAGGVAVLSDSIQDLGLVLPGAYVRYVSTRPTGDTLCAREFNLYESRSDSYADTFYALDFSTGAVDSFSVALRKSEFDLPHVFCL